MHTIAYLKFGEKYLAYLFEDDEYFEIGKTKYEAIGKLWELLVENKVIDNIEFKYIDKSEKRSDLEIMDRLAA